MCFVQAACRNLQIFVFTFSRWSALFTKIESVTVLLILFSTRNLGVKFRACVYTSFISEPFLFVLIVHRSRTNVKKYSVHNRFPIFSGLLAIVLRSDGQISVEILKNISRASSPEIDQHTISPYNVNRFLSSQVMMRLKEIVNSGYYLVPPNFQNYYFKGKQGELVCPSLDCYVYSNPAKS